jgi:hypothetical protein
MPVQMRRLAPFSSTRSVAKEAVRLALDDCPSIDHPYALERFQNEIEWGDYRHGLEDFEGVQS